MRLILSRHGNTFEHSLQAYWVGGANDLPLVEEGRNQAKRAGQTLKKQGIRLKRIYCAPLKRTHEYAAILLSEMGLDIVPTIDERLREIDYGNWAGKSNDEIRKLYGQEEIDAWQKHNRWPASGNWSPNEDEIIRNIQSFSNDLIHDNTADNAVLAVSSNGILRYFLKLAPDAFDRRFKERALKVRTGNLCSLHHDGSGFSVDFWDKKPAEWV